MQQSFLIEETAHPKSTQGYWVDVLVVGGPSEALTYAIPDAWQNDIREGMLVRVPLGGRQVVGIVIKVKNHTQLRIATIKYILAKLYPYPVLTTDLIQLIQWMAFYYAAGLSSVIEAILPSIIRDPIKLKEKIQVELLKMPQTEEWVALSKRSPKQAAVLTYLKEASAPVLKNKILNDLSITTAVYNALLKKGLIEEKRTQLIRTTYDDALADEEGELIKPIFELNEEQAAAAEDIKKSLSRDEFAVHLLHGVTGSGKTEVYIEAAKAALAAGGSVLFLVPEVALAPQTVSRLRSRLSANGLQAVVWHSHLSDGERMDAWLSMARGEARIAVGARSAVFSPLQDLKLIIVDEEHEGAYKQDCPPRYHGRDVAVYRSKLLKGVCVLGSATPSLESLYNTQIKGYHLNRILKRVDDRLLPPMHIVDMRREPILHKGGGFLSRFLFEKIQNRLESKEQVMIFLNRRGFAPRVVCKKCGCVAECPHCSMTLTYHSPTRSVRCHWCTFERPLPKSCSQCKSSDLEHKGTGTQRIEDLLKTLLPQARIGRLDADLFSKKHSFRHLLNDFRKGKIDILIGTQMIAKGLDFPNVTLVGLIDADLSLHIPDFRASERTFQLLVQVAGRAGRGDRAGEVVVQSFNPASAPIQFARRSDFDGFLDAELEERKVLNYPPFRHIIRHVFRARNEEKARFVIEEWANVLKAANINGLEIRGPAPAPREKVQDYYRYHLWYFTPNVSRVLPYLAKLRDAFRCDKDIIDVIDVDPVDLG